MFGLRLEAKYQSNQMDFEHTRLRSDSKRQRQLVQE
jgi:hypothetical protein